jgi:hypothetical protein
MIRKLRANIAILEIYSHHVFVHTIASSLILAGHNVTIYVSARIYKDLEPMFPDTDQNLKFCVSANGEGDFAFLKRIRSEINRTFDLLCINSIQGYRIGYFYLLKFKVPTIAAAGRISEFFGSSYKISGLKTVRRIAHHNYTKYLLPKVVERLEGLIVHTEKAKQLGLSEGYSKPIHCMPFSLHIKQPSIIESPKDSVQFLITGSITERCRDYFSVLSLFESIWNDGITTAKLTVLSSPKTDYGYKVYNEMQRLGDKGYPITYFSGWIPEQEFVSETAKADFLIAPILEEYYGSGEITSVEVESVRMGTPAFYPDWYFVDNNRKESSIFYSSFIHLKKLVTYYATNISKVRPVRARARKNAEELSVENVSKKLNDFLNQNIFDPIKVDSRRQSAVDE